MNQISSPLPEAALDDLEELYRDVEKALEPLGAACRRDGACCRFGESGMRLYLSGLEMALLLREAGPGFPPPADATCPFLVGGACSVRGGRALGCRCYFCEPSVCEATAAIYETFHAAIRRLHVRYGIPYRYEELIAALGGCRESESPH